MGKFLSSDALPLRKVLVTVTLSIVKVVGTADLLLGTAALSLVKESSVQLLYYRGKFSIQPLYPWGKVFSTVSISLVIKSPRYSYFTLGGSSQFSHFTPGTNSSVQPLYPWGKYSMQPLHP